MEEKEKTSLEQLADDLKAIRKALEHLEKIGLNKELMILYINKKARVGVTAVRAVLDAQKQFLEEAFETKSEKI